MGSFIAQQPNGLYCRFSTIVDTVTHYNMTKDDYIEVCKDRLGKKRGEEEAREAAEDCYECHYDDSLEMRLVKEAFRQGAEWQSKQSPWISVKELLLEELESVLVGTNYEGRYYYEVAFVMNGKWVCHNSKPIYWMPIPSFDDILEANRDVLERIKEKGD